MAVNTAAFNVFLVNNIVYLALMSRHVCVCSTLNSVTLPLYILQRPQNAHICMYWKTASKWTDINNLLW